jgi:hypothetical protein
MDPNIFGYTSLNLLGNNSSYLSVPGSNLSFGSGSYTIQWWQYFTGSNTPNTSFIIFSIGSFPNPEFGVELYFPVDPLDDPVIRLRDSTGVIISLSNPTLRPNRWSPITLIRDVTSSPGTVGLIIIVGPSSSATYPSGPPTNYNFTQNLIIGNDTNLNNSTSFKGQIYNFQWFLGLGANLIPGFDIPDNPSASGKFISNKIISIDFSFKIRIAISI